MRFNVTYADYKDQNIVTSFFKYNIKNKVDIIHCKTICKKNNIIDTNKEFKISDTITEYKDNNGDTNYRLELLLQLPNRKYGKKEKKLNKICSTIYMNVLENHESNNKITLIIDEEKLDIFDKIDNILYDMDVSINIYDNIGLVERISRYNNNNNNNNLNI